MDLGHGFGWLLRGFDARVGRVFIPTDSVGLQEKACILKVPCVTLRDTTGRPEMREAGTNIPDGTQPERLQAAARRIRESVRTGENPAARVYTKACDPARRVLLFPLCCHSVLPWTCSQVLPGVRRDGSPVRGNLIRAQGNGYPDTSKRGVVYNILLWKSWRYSRCW